MRKWTIGEMRKQTQFKANFGAISRVSKAKQTQFKANFGPIPRVSKAKQTQFLILDVSSPAFLSWVKTNFKTIPALNCPDGKSWLLEKFCS
jgi:hypothetical protein